MHHQPVDAPADRHRQDQRQQQIGGDHGGDGAEDKLVNARRIRLQHQIGERLGRAAALHRIERQGDLHRQFEQAGDKQRDRLFVFETGVQRLKGVGQHHVGARQDAGGLQGLQNSLSLGDIRL